MIADKNNRMNPSKNIYMLPLIGQQGKFVVLNNNKTTKLPSNNPITNLTGQVIPAEILKFLELGPKYNLNQCPIPLIDIIAPIEANLHHHPEFNDTFGKN